MRMYCIFPKSKKMVGWRAGVESCGEGRSHPMSRFRGNGWLSGALWGLFADPGADLFGCGHLWPHLPLRAVHLSTDMSTGGGRAVLNHSFQQLVMWILLGASIFFPHVSGNQCAKNVWEPCACRLPPWKTHIPFEAQSEPAEPTMRRRPLTIGLSPFVPGVNPELIWWILFPN